MDFRDRQQIKRIQFLIDRLTKDENVWPLKLYHGKDYERMNDNVRQNIQREVIVLPFGSGGLQFFTIVGRNWTEVWKAFCEVLQGNLFKIADDIRKKQKKLLNVDELQRKMNAFREEVEKEENITLPPLELKTEKVVE